ncbi:MAG: hypothetical protein Q9181_006642, partial [Wetmoreana brouardii]
MCPRSLAPKQEITSPITVLEEIKREFEQNQLDMLQEIKQEIHRATGQNKQHFLQEVSQNDKQAVRRAWVGTSPPGAKKVPRFEMKSSEKPQPVPEQTDDTEDDDESGLSLFTIVADLESDPVNSQYYNHSLHGEGAESIDTGVEKIYEHRLKTFSIRSSEFGGDHQLVNSVFVALGWLVEHNKDPHDKTKRTTYYVVLLNLTTAPTSVWLTFDYHTKDHLEDEISWTNRLGDYHNALFTRSRAEVDFNPLPDEFSASGGSAKGDPPPFLEAHADFGDMANTTVQQDKAQKHEEGYFGLPPFDLALLAADINDRTVNGFDQKLVKAHLDACHIRCGLILRAKSVKDSAQLELIRKKNKRVHIK